MSQVGHKNPKGVALFALRPLKSVTFRPTTLTLGSHIVGKEGRMPRQTSHSAAVDASWSKV